MRVLPVTSRNEKKNDEPPVPAPLRWLSFADAFGLAKGARGQARTRQPRGAKGESRFFPSLNGVIVFIFCIFFKIVSIFIYIYFCSKLFFNIFFWLRLGGNQIGFVLLGCWGRKPIQYDVFNGL